MDKACGKWRMQDNKNRQGSVQADDGTMVFITDPDVIFKLDTEEAELHAHARQVYQTRLDLGVAREQARKDLPLSTYTEAYWKIDLRNLMHFLHLRLDNNAQYEIRQYAQAIVRLLEPDIPLITELVG